MTSTAGVLCAPEEVEETAPLATPAKPSSRLMPKSLPSACMAGSCNAIYQAERAELEGSVSLKQMERLAAAMGAHFVYAIVPNDKVEKLKYEQAMAKAHNQIAEIEGAQTWSADMRQDWVEDRAAELLHDMPIDFWEAG